MSSSDSGTTSTDGDARVIIDHERMESLLQAMIAIGEKNRSMQKVLRADVLVSLCDTARVQWSMLGGLIEVTAPINVCGDIHGQYADLMRLFEENGWPPAQQYIFLGDYVDRGPHNIETAVVLMLMSLLYPTRVHLLRGNHECASINRVYGFYDECARRYSVSVWTAFQDAFACLPPTGLISSRILCMHGGISDGIRTWDDLRTLPQNQIDPDTSTAGGALLSDVLWSDPVRGCLQWCDSPRNAGKNFGEVHVKEFCTRMNIDLIARAHQVVQDGYEFFADRRLVTMFSAPHYCNEYTNDAAVMNVAADLRIRMTVLHKNDKPPAVTLTRSSRSATHTNTTCVEETTSKTKTAGKSSMSGKTNKHRAPHANKRSHSRKR